MSGWHPPAELKSQAVALVRRLAAAEGGLWNQALEAIERDDSDGTALVYDRLAESRPGSTDQLRPWAWLGPAGLDEGLAALAFLGNDPLKAFHESARLERWSVRPGKARAFADEAALALGAPERTRDLLPPPVTLGAGLGIMVLLAGFLLFGPFRHVSSPRFAGFIMVGLAVLLSVALAISMAERAEVYFVSIGGSAMAVPSTAASISFEVQPGSIGTVLQRIPLWVFVEFHDGRNAWLPESEICLY